MAAFLKKPLRLMKNCSGQCLRHIHNSSCISTRVLTLREWHHRSFFIYFFFLKTSQLIKCYWAKIAGAAALQAPKSSC